MRSARQSLQERYPQTAGIQHFRLQWLWNGRFRDSFGNTLYSLRTNFLRQSQLTVYEADRKVCTVRHVGGLKGFVSCEQTILDDQDTVIGKVTFYGDRHCSQRPFWPSHKLELGAHVYTFELTQSGWFWNEWCARLGDQEIARVLETHSPEVFLLRKDQLFPVVLLLASQYVLDNTGA